MQVIKREFQLSGRSEEVEIIPLGDIHLGAAACDEKLLQRAVKYIADNNCYWIGMGDYCDFINRRDPRFDYSQLAPWIGIAELGDLAKVQATHFLEYVKPIAHKCLALLCGNHETAIMKHTERDIYSDIINGVKEAGKFKDDDKMGLGYYGWLQLKFRQGKRESKEGTYTINGNLHHGFTGGKLAGAKALSMQRWLWSHEADFVLFGHSHNSGIQPEAVESIDRDGNVKIHVRKGAYCGTFLRSINPNGAASYSEVAGYLPLPMSGIRVILRPGAEHQQDRVRMVS